MTKHQTIEKRKASQAEPPAKDRASQKENQKPSNRKKPAEPDIFYEIIGQAIKSKRAAKKYSLTVMAALSGVAYETIWALENGRVNTSIDTLRKIAKVLDCSLRSLLPEEGVYDPIKVNILIERDR